MSKSVTGITQRNKRSIRDVERKRRDSDNGEGSDGGSGRRKKDAPRSQPPGRYDSDRAATFGLWFVGIIGLFFIFFLFSVIFAETTVTVYPETASIAIDDTFTATNDPEISGIPFTVVSAESTIELAATSSGSEYREEVASGQVRIYNDYTNESIRLVPNTRFESSDGLIYRIREAVTVPGQTSSGAGSVTAIIYADEVGAEHNRSSGTLSIPGFAGTAYEEGVYAEVETVISGGIAGDVPVIATSTQTMLEEEAAVQLRDQLTSEVMADIPDGFILYDDALFFSTSIGTGSDETASESTLEVTGTLQAAVFDGRQLSSFLATNYSSDVSSDSHVLISDLQNYDFSIEDKDDVNLDQAGSFEFSLAGTSQIVWQFDERALIRDLRGLQKDRLNEVLVNYESIQEAEVVTRPFWKRTLPDDAPDITVNTVNR